MNSLDVKELSKVYNKKTVVNKLDLTIKQGSIFGFLGKNGAGKSTLINMVTGIVIPTSGEYNIYHSQKKIGVLPDYSTFYDNLTGIQHLKYFSEIIGVQLSNQKIEELIKKVGLDEYSKKKLKNYSFGMKKKLGIAQALINNPEIVFLDEPTSGVDPNSILIIHDLIKEISKEGTTVILTSHNLNEIEKLCDEIVIMDKGDFKVKGSLENIKNEFNKIIKLQGKVDSINYNVLNELQKEIEGIMSCELISTEEFCVDLSTELVIPIINEKLVKKNIKVFSLTINKPTLEEIFIETN